MVVNVTFDGGRLRAARQRKGFTQAELARRAGVRERQIIRWEHAQNAPRPDAIAALARALGVSPGDLFDEDADDEDAELVSIDDLIRRRVDHHIRRALADVAEQGGAAS